MSNPLNYEFDRVLPAHRNLHHDSAENMRYHLQSCIAWMKTRS